MEKKKTFYITTPLYYSSGKLHLGHCYTTVICDSVARFKRMEGRDVFFLTGTDEHGQNIARRAAEKGMQPKEYVDALYADIKKLWELMDISYDKFIRTTDDYHEQAVKEIFTRLYEKGDIYKAEYEGWYCSPCESFWTEAQLVDGKCPDCGREVASKGGKLFLPPVKVRRQNFGVLPKSSRFSASALARQRNAEQFYQTGTKRPVRVAQLGKVGGARAL
jgi:methionyl-tRNA synthetase